MSVCSRLKGVVEARGRLAAVDDLEIAHALKPHVTVLLGLNFDGRGGAAEAVVVGEEAVRLLLQRLLQAFIDFAFRLEEGAHVALQQTLAVLAIDAREHGRG